MQKISGIPIKDNLNHTHITLNWFVILCVFMFPVSFLMVRHGVHVSLFALVALALFYFWSVKTPKIALNNSIDAVILSTFAGLFLSVLISQVFRGAIHFAAFDGPSRILLAGIVFLLLKSLNIPYIKILSIAIPVGLICLFLSLQLNPGAYWGERYATYFVDPNTLGSQSLILGLLSFLMIDWGVKKSKTLISLQMLGGLLGLYISIGSGSRGGWLTAPFIILLALFVRLRDISLARSSQKPKMWLQTGVICIATFFIFLIGFSFSDKLSNRIINGYHEVYGWISGSELDSSAGARLSIWKFSLQFAGESLLLGYGEEKNMLDTLQNSQLNVVANELPINIMAATGPHSDIPSKLLSAGLFGLGAYLSLLLVPFYIFWRRRNAPDFNVKQAARIGLFYITGIFIAGLSNEQLSLKYLCTFYGLMIAVLLAQVLHRPSAAQINSGSPVLRVG